MKNNLFLLVAVVLNGAMLSCSSSDVSDDWEGKKVVNMVADPQPIQLTAEQKVFANDNNKFTLNFLKAVNEVDQSGKSFIYSPLSITYVLGMVNDAAVGTTEKELEETLGFHKGGIQAVNDYCKKLIDGLPKVDKGVTLNIANAIFLNKEYTLKKKFEQDMVTYYDAKAEALDFSSPQTLSHINGWCNDKTNGMIPTILDEVRPDMISYLLNAIYFKADWYSKFDPKNTKEENFHPEFNYLMDVSDNPIIKLPMMHQNVLISYIKNDIYSAISIPYGNCRYSMTLLLPEEGKTTYDVIAEMTKDGWKIDFTNLMSAYEVDLKLPRFETASDTDELNVEKGLVGLMKKMGINLAFDSDFAEIPNMCEMPVYIDMMRQKAKIKVNEEGSEVAVVTTAGVNMKDAFIHPKATFHANRPFVYMISESSSGVILFVGKFTGQ